jgi:hypothetical protein
MQATLQQIETYLRHINKDEAAFRVDLSEGFTIYHRQASQLLECLKRRDYQSVAVIMEDTLKDSWGKTALAFHEKQQADALAAVGGSIHERGLRMGAR